MSYLRGQERAVYQRTFEHMKSVMLDELGWAGSGAPVHYPWGASYPLHWEERAPDPKLGALQENTVAFTEGRQPDDEEEELGADSPGGLMSSTHTFFIDIYGENGSIARSIAGDIASIFKGRAGPGRYLTLPDYRLDGAPDAPGHLLHFEDVETDYPSAAGGTARGHWVVVKITAVHEWNG